MACEAGNMTSARCAVSHIFGTEGAQEGPEAQLSLGYKLLMRQLTEVLCERSCSSTKKAASV